MYSASLHTGILAPQHCPCGRGLLSILPDLESRSLGITGVGLAFRIKDDITNEADSLPSGLDNTLGEHEPGPPRRKRGAT